MKYFILFMFFVLEFGFAQQPVNVNKENATFEIGSDNAPFLRATSKSLPKVEGSTYLDKEWQQASITDIGTKKVVKLLARFNAYSKEIEILKEKDFVALKPVAGLSVELNDKTFIPVRTKDDTKAFFAEAIVQGKFSLFRVFDVRIVKAVSDATLLNVENNDRVTIIDKLYYSNDTETIGELPKKKKMVLALFDNETQSFISKEKLSVKKNEELIRAIQQYNKNAN